MFKKKSLSIILIIAIGIRRERKKTPDLQTLHSEYGIYLLLNLLPCFSDGLETTKHSFHFITLEITADFRHSIYKLAIWSFTYYFHYNVQFSRRSKSFQAKMIHGEPI